MVGALSGTVALVTGASSGIGEATALALAGEGAQVAIAARRADRLESLAAKLGGPSRALVLKVDVTEEDEVGQMVARTVAEFGRLDTLVNNAGVMLLGPVLDAPTDEWRRMVQLNLLGLLYCTHAGLPHLLQAASGAPRQVADVVNVSSVAGRVARQGSAVYNATKFGVGAFSESLRQEVTARHVRVTIVEPGVVATELVGHNRPEVQQTIRGTFGTLEPLQSSDIADAVVYAVTRPRHVALNEILVRPTMQER
ncbi:MAG: SDR family NAD(P)-dependent oxidoreductase [Candidatus Dormibacteraeota bacterium]|nr:SDR family NAD(P)-dependent oxidoreductase [Candidatus Dormibacteraeota bacterium]